MPVISVKMWSGRDAETKEKLIHALTDATVEALQCPAEVVTVVLEEQPKENWGIGGVCCATR